MNSVKVERLGPGDEDRLADAAPGVFDNAVDPDLAGRFLAGGHNVLVAAFEGKRAVGFASGFFLGFCLWPRVTQDEKTLFRLTASACMLITIGTLVYGLLFSQSVMQL